MQWFVLTTPITLDSRQIAAFTGLVDDNARPVQPLNARAAVTDVVH